MMEHRQRIARVDLCSRAPCAGMLGAALLRAGVECSKNSR